MYKQLPKMDVVGLVRAETCLAKKSYAGIISIASPHDNLLGYLPQGYAGVPERLRLEFADLHNPESSDPHAPSVEQVKCIIQFAEKMKNIKGRILIHCAFGMNRSPAAAFIVNAVWMGKGAETDAYDRMRSFCFDSKPFPNYRMVVFADELLERNGKLIAAFDKAHPNGPVLLQDIAYRDTLLG